MTLAAVVNTLGQDLLRRHGERVHKLALDVGFTCPNRDGSKGTGPVDMEYVAAVITEALDCMDVATEELSKLSTGIRIRQDEQQF